MRHLTCAAAAALLVTAQARAQQRPNEAPPAAVTEDVGATQSTEARPASEPSDVAQGAQDGPATRNRAPEPPSDVTPSTPSESAQDPLWRSSDPSVVQPQDSLFEDAMGVTGNEDAVVQPGHTPPPEGVPVQASAVEAPPIRKAEHLDLRASGFAHADLQFLVFDGGDYTATFRPREVELDLEAGVAKGARVRLDFNVEASMGFGSPLDRLVDSLVEQAFVEWSPWLLTLAAGKMDSPIGLEPLDPVDRVATSTSWTSRLATPASLTGALLQANVIDEAGLFLLASNGWDKATDNNRSKTFGVGIPHRVWKVDGGWFYEGTVGFIIGPERSFNNDQRWLVDYSGRVRLVSGLTLLLEGLYGEEGGLGHDARTGALDTEQAAKWYGGIVGMEVDAGALSGSSVDGLLAGLRVEYLHDHDLLLGLPTERALPPLTTLLGFTATVRYQLLDGIDVALEYRGEFQRGDVPNLSVHRNKSFTSLAHWFVTQEITATVIGRF